MSEYFVKPCYGKIWHFCYNKSGICYCVMTSDTLTNYEVLVSDGTADFDVVIDDNDNIHLVYQNNNGDIIYAYYTKNDWFFTPVLKSKTQGFYNKGIRIIRVNNWLNILYTVDYKGKKLITHQFINANDIQPTAVDVTKNDFCVTSDSQGNIILFYYSENALSYGIKKYIWSKKVWTDFEAKEVHENFDSAYIFVDETDKIHITGCLDGNVVYIGDETEIVGSGVNPIIIEKDALYIIWEKSGTVVASVSADNGITFNKGSEFISGKFNLPKIFNIRNTVYEKGYNAYNSYGYITQDNRAVLYSLKEFFTILRNPPKPIEQNLQKEANKYMESLKGGSVFDELKKINHRLDEIKAMVEKLM